MNINWYLRSLTDGPKRTNNGCIHRWPTITLITIIQLVLIVFECFINVSSLSLNTSQTLRTIHFDSGPVYQVTVNRVTGDVIVGGRNAIYRLNSKDLSLIEQFKTGPVIDSINCLPQDDTCGDTKTQVNNDNQILVLNNPVLLACGSAYQGMCYLLKATNISGYNTLYGPPNDTINFVASKTSSVAFFAPSSTGKGNVLFVATAYDGRPLDMSPPVVSSRRLYGYHNFVLAHNTSTSYSKVDFHLTYKPTFNVKYIYGFNFSHYSYFVSVQPINVRTHNYETKLIRICNNDNEFFSYMEMPLQCSPPNGYSSGSRKLAAEYLLATTAYLAKIGAQNPENYDSLKIIADKEADTLFIAMSVPTSGSTIDTSIGSAICAFSLIQINKAFTAAVRECFRGGVNNKVHLLEVINGNKQECNQIPSDVRDDFCGTGHNPYMETNRPLNGLFLTSINGQVTSLAVDIHNTRTVAVIGTSDGQLSKVVLDEPQESEKPIFQYQMPSVGHKDRSIRPNPVFDNKNKTLYVLSSNQLIELPFGSCKVHKTCNLCLSSADPLNCGWCGSYCATDHECQTPSLMNRTGCPPEIHDFWPKSGPISGGTVVTIIGDNLGENRNSYENSNITVKVAESPCHVISWSMKKVECKTNPIIKEVSGTIRVQVHDRRPLATQHPYDIEGVVVSIEKFKYLVPQLMGINPSFGPYDGGTNITIIGHNLHIGSNRTILLSNITCKEFENNSTFLKCTSGRYSSSSSKLTPETSVKLVIDGETLVINSNKTIHKPKTPNEKNDFSMAMDWSEFFEYKPNPRIYSFEPNSTIKSGNTNITVTGVNLNSVAKPRVQVIGFSGINNQNRFKSDGNCWVNPSGTQMTCQTPDLNSTKPSPEIVVSKETKLNFILDGVNNTGLPERLLRLIYYPDPTFHNFEDGLQVVWYEEPELRIIGKNLRIDYPIDIWVSDELEIPCYVIKTNNIDEISCSINDTSGKILDVDGRKHRVFLRVGNILLSPGEMTFEYKPAPMSLGAIAAIVLVTVVLMAATVLFVYIYGQRKGLPFLKQPIPPAFTAHYNPTVTENGRPPYVSQSSSNDYRGGECSRLLSVESDGRSRRFQVPEEKMALLRAEHILIERENLVLCEVIGQGHFGQVYKAILHSPEKEAEREVAVKTIIRDEMDVESFLEEGLMMKDFSHHHVLTLIGVCFEDEGMPIVVLPYMQNGDLLSYIRNENNNPTVKSLLMFAIEIAMGMDYLSGQKFVHRDLAARNCMLDSDLCVKVADFGLSRDIYERDYYSSDNKKCKLPVKWMSPESLEKGTYNTKTDVWSYGVLVWELLTRGVTPYPDVDNWEILNYLKQGRRMPRPSFCPELLYYILLRCWSDDHRLRPTFTELVNEVEDVITRLEKEADKQRVDLDKCNTYINFPVPNIYYNETQAKQSESKETDQGTTSTSTTSNNNNDKPNEANSEAPNTSVYETTC